MCLSFFHQIRNGHQERIDFLTSREKKVSKKKTGIVIGVIVGLLLLAGLAALLIWLFVCKSAINSRTSRCWDLKYGSDTFGWVKVEHHPDVCAHESHPFLTEVKETVTIDNIYIPDAQTGTKIKNCKVDHFNLLFKLHSLILDWESDLCGCCNSPLVFAFLTASTLFFNNAKKKNVRGWACTLFNIHLIPFFLFKPLKSR